METKEITVSYKRTYNLGNYESAALSFSAVVGIEEGEAANDVAKKTWDACVQQVHKRAAGIREAVTVEQKGAPAQPAQKKEARPVGEFDGEFEATDLVCEVNKGKTFWKLTNVPGTKFDVNIWPEVLLAEYGDSDDLDPMKAYSLAGYTARFINNEKGYPQKIVKLWRKNGEPRPQSDNEPPPVEEDEIPF